MDLILIMAIIGLVVFFFKRFSNVVYVIAIIDIFLRIVNFINVKLLTGTIHTWISNNIPANIPVILSKYASGLLYNILIYLYVIVFILFEAYIIKAFFKRN